MRVLGLNPGHDGAATYIADGRLVISVEAEKDSFPRFSELGPHALLAALEAAPSAPDVIAVGGWHNWEPGLYWQFRAGYDGLEKGTVRRSKFLGKTVELFTSSHERSHLFMTAGMHPSAPIEECAILVWEGGIGAFYRWREFGEHIERFNVMSDPGSKYAALFAIADPAFPTGQPYPRLEDAGKMMALAAYGRELDVLPEDRAVVDQLVGLAHLYPFSKGQYAGSPLFDCGLDNPRFCAAAHYASQSIFGVFHRAAERIFRGDRPSLLIAGGCGLNCDWNEAWRRSTVFSDVFVPPCTNDSGSALGTAIDAMVHAGEPCRVDWSVFSGPDFSRDEAPDPNEWVTLGLDYDAVAARLAQGKVVAWVQGRSEIGPRALGHRSLLASPLQGSMRHRLNEIKGREHYRPIAPCCRGEDLHRWFTTVEPDSYMLYFAHVDSTDLPAVTHVDGTARVQAVWPHDNPRLHKLLGTFGQATRHAVLCNTSLNFQGLGFINRTSDLMRYCADRRIGTIVVDDQMYLRRER